MFDSFLLAFTALFSIVNPLAMALIFSQVTADSSPRDRARLAGLVGLYSAVVMLTALWAGAYVLNFFGVSMAALRIAGGFVVAERAWALLTAPERHEARKQEQAAGDGDALAESAFFPMTIPFTTGPGTISVAIALGSTRPTRGDGLMEFFLGMSGAALAIAALVWLSYRSADRIVALLGPTRVRVLTRLFAFLLFCVGVQILLTGVLDAFPLLSQKG
ncbi:multiple antibiotic resistance protein (plasmid) [Azospirillum sp. B510]|uniref:MarC family protein n=1 Tax=Azospirillum sp. (strain B510) TaxID=137722 RepID=UPI0001C4C590|nr:MarC family protein [Azospirillum sp. B510]BAI75978.1 multiple antibiotic resistance protein [Azospirillum sp. B510]